MSLVVRESRVHGLGLFAAEGFRAGDLVLAIDDSRVVDEAHPLLPSDDPVHCDYLADGMVVLMPYPERHINHSCDPNVYVATRGGRRVVLALRDVQADEEIAYDYSINGGGNTLWTCSCGAKRCRQIIHSDFFHLPIALQHEYLPLLDDWFREERASQLSQLTPHSISR
jgi:hypothetical protein